MQSPKAGMHCCVLTGRKGAGEGTGRGHPRGTEATRVRTLGFTPSKIGSHCKGLSRGAT